VSKKNLSHIQMATKKALGKGKEKTRGASSLVEKEG